jgi:drug/metabolite transporter (DMT)-like permease
MELWIPMTIAAAFLQNIRSVLQRRLKDHMGASGATLVRFLYGIPVAGLIIAALHVHAGLPLPDLNARFAFWIMVGSIGQVTAQVLLLMAFGERNFTVATAYSRTEPVHAALIGFVALGELPGIHEGLAILLAVVGVMVISVARETFSPLRLVTSLGSRGAIFGLASGAVFGLTAVAYRAASTALGGPESGPAAAQSVLMQASMTLMVAVLIQSAMLIVFMGYRKRAELAAVFRLWRPGALVGLVGATASFLWFAAMTMQQAAIVKALGQIEMIFTYAATLLVFRERVNSREIVGCLLIIAGVLALLA